MADEEAKPAGTKTPKAPKEKKPGALSPGLLVLIVAVLFVASMASAFLAVTFLGKNVGGAAAVKQDPKKNDVPVGQMGPTQDVGNFTVNLADPGQRVFVKAGVVFELSNAAVQAEVTSRDPQVKDIVINVLGSRTMADVASPEGREGIKSAIAQQVNKLLTQGKVRSVYFTEFVFQ